MHVIDTFKKWKHDIFMMDFWTCYSIAMGVTDNMLKVSMFKGQQGF